MKIAITGATGFIGRNLCRALKENGIEIVGITRKNSRKDYFDENNLAYYDFRGTEEDIHFFQKEKFDIVIHLATLYLVKNSLQDIKDLIDTNITFGTRILEICSITGTKNFINTSSFIQNFEGKSYSPVNLYASTKQSFEDIGKYYGESGELNFISLSLVNSYGPGDERKKIFNIWKESLDKNKMIESTSGEQYINILYISDIIDAYLKLISLIEEKKEEILNLRKFAINSDQIVKLKDLAIIFEEVVGKKLNILWGAIPHREREVMYPHNIGEQIPGWKQKVSLQKGIQLFIK